MTRLEDAGRPTGALARAHAAVVAALWSIWATARGDIPADDRGSDSSEKAFMIILAITAAGIVTVAAVAYINSKTSLFE